jgi:hypothetical protein
MDTRAGDTVRDKETDVISGELRAAAGSPPPTRVLSLLVAAFAAVIHVPFLAARPFFFADDFGWLADADNLRRGTTRFFELPEWGAWRLGQRAFWWVEYSLFGLSPMPYHLINVALHAAAVGMLTALLIRFGAPRGRALLAGALFAAWSVPSLTVCYPSVGAVLLATLAVLAAVAAHDSRKAVWATAAMLVGASFYEQALCAPVAMLLANFVRRRHPLWAGLTLPSGAAAVFVAVNFWTLRGTTKVFAYNAGGAQALRQAAVAPLSVVGWTERLAPFWAAVVFLALLVGLALAWRPARGLLPGIAFAWISALPLLGRNVNWSEWYFYMPAAGVAVALALAAPRSRLWTVPCLLLLAWNLYDQKWRARYFADQAENYRQVTLSTPPSRDATAAVLVNIHSGLAWTGWQFGGSIQEFELWQSPAGRAGCFVGSSLEEARRNMRRQFPDAQLRSSWPADMPPALKTARAPARHELFPWPAAR